MIADAEGNVVGRGAAAGGNPTSHPVSAAANFGQALHAALAGLDPTAVKAAVVGAAGGSALARPDVAAQFDAAAASLVTAEPNGIVLENFRAVAIPDSHGLITWSIGDSGFKMTL